MNFALVMGPDGVWRMTWDRPTDISGLVWLSLNIEQGNFFNLPNYGLKTSDIRKVTANNITVLKQRVEQALAWLITTGKAKDLTVIVERDSSDYSRINWKVEITQADGLPLTVTGFRTVGAQDSATALV